ncbi:hypothetical protein GCM10010095_34050 [Streptomyces anthocyanicus]|nr:hypothetical protein GCM10010095_34050 [Streptomyces anthocyanicus]
MEGTGPSVPGGTDSARNQPRSTAPSACEAAGETPGSTRGPRRLRGTLSPLGTAARSNIGRGVCGPGRPKDEEPEQSGQRAPVPRSVLLCGEGGSLTITLRDEHGQFLSNHCGLDH